MTSQQVDIARQTAKRKTAELAVTNSAAKRTLVQLDARTVEVDAAKRQIALLKERYDWDDIADRTLAVYKKVLNHAEDNN